MRVSDAALRNYFRSIRSWLPCPAKQKQQILSQVKENVFAFLEEYPDAGMCAIENQFGSPRQIAAAYVDDMDTPALLSALRIRKRVFLAVIAGLIAAMLLWGWGVSTAIIEQRNINYGHLETEIIEH